MLKKLWNKSTKAVGTITILGFMFFILLLVIDNLTKHPVIKEENDYDDDFDEYENDFFDEEIYEE